MRHLLLALALSGLWLPGPARAEGGPHYLLRRGPAPKALELALDEELPGARTEAGRPHALRVVVSLAPPGEAGSEPPAPLWRLELRRPGGRLLLTRDIDTTGGEEAALRVVVFLCSRTLARFGPGDDVLPAALAELEPEIAETPEAPEAPRRRPAVAVLATLPWWQQPARPRPAIALEAGLGSDRLRLSLRLQAAPPTRISSSEVEARITDTLVAGALELGLLRGVRGELGVGIAAGLRLGWTTARARFPAAPGSPGVEARFFDPAPWGQTTVNLAIDPGDPRVEILARAGLALRPLPRRILAPDGTGDSRIGLDEGFVTPVLELGLRALF